ncbi:hypothetical protein L1987_37931 [Smallanthus sonchifolius]|uniref:Uncharacterized protein n=1 Tax=Smallanthus sonchifolius TaxID=185202 RepID=A0ACB9HJ53_9ASTR|nr:hypothetical protein L1987_37931 [Smallanthus sonchifolius]
MERDIQIRPARSGLLAPAVWRSNTPWIRVIPLGFFLLNMELHSRRKMDRFGQVTKEIWSSEMRREQEKEQGKVLALFPFIPLYTRLRWKLNKSSSLRLDVGVEYKQRYNDGDVIFEFACTLGHNHDDYDA